MQNISRDGSLRETSYTNLLRIISLTCIAAGVAMRLLHFGTIPPGLNQDEASVGYDAWSLAHFGTDGNGNSWPVHLVSWGSGGNASYAYMAAPFVAFGLSPLTIRLPMLFSSLATLPLVWFATRHLFDEKAAWGGTTAVALSPWHIMLSRWGLDCNALLFLFLCALALLVKSLNTQHKTIVLVTSCSMFGVSVYSYGSAYLAVPLFVFSALLLCFVRGLFTIREALMGAIVFSLISTPIALYVLVNLFQWNSITIGGLTIPRLPVTARFQTQLAAGPQSHISNLMEVLWSQRDGTSYNVTDPFGVLYSSVFFALGVGFVVLLPILVAKQRLPMKTLFISLWILAALPVGMLQEPNINRINLLLMGLVIAAGLALAAIDRWARGALIVSSLLLLTLSAFFARDYFTTQRDLIADDFFDGLLPALTYAQNRVTPDAKICVTADINMPYIFALFTEPRDPQDYLRSVKYLNPTAPFRRVISFGRYTFDLKRCDLEKTKVIISRSTELIASPFVKTKRFRLFDVYLRP